jgi:hypothetical protein
MRGGRKHVLWQMIAGTVVAAVVLIETVGRIPMRHSRLTTPKLKALLDMLRDRGDMTGYVEIRVRNSPFLLRVRKGVASTGELGFQIGIPRSLIEKRPDILREVLSQHGVLEDGLPVDHGGEDITVASISDVSGTVMVVESLLRFWAEAEPPRDCIAIARRSA